jgi:hypothetical protein
MDGNIIPIVAQEGQIGIHGKVCGVLDTTRYKTLLSIPSVLGRRSSTDVHRRNRA